MGWVLGLGPVLQKMEGSLPRRRNCTVPSALLFRGIASERELDAEEYVVSSIGASHCWASRSDSLSLLFVPGLPEEEWESIRSVDTLPFGALGFSTDGRLPHAADLIQVLVLNGRFGVLREDGWLESPAPDGPPLPAGVHEEPPIAVFPNAEGSFPRSPGARQPIETDASATVLLRRVETGAPVFDPLKRATCMTAAALVKGGAGSLKGQRAPACQIYTVFESGRRTPGRAWAGSSPSSVFTGCLSRSRARRSCSLGAKEARAQRRQRRRWAGADPWCRQGRPEAERKRSRRGRARLTRLDPPNEPRRPAEVSFVHEAGNSSLAYQQVHFPQLTPSASLVSVGSRRVMVAFAVVDATLWFATFCAVSLKDRSNGCGQVVSTCPLHPSNAVCACSHREQPAPRAVLRPSISQETSEAADRSSWQLCSAAYHLILATALQNYNFLQVPCLGPTIWDRRSQAKP